MQSGQESADRNAWVLAGLRIAVGALFLIFGEYKVFGTQFTLGGGFQSWINRFLAGGTYPLMAPVLRGFILPHGTPIAFLVAYGELAIRSEEHTSELQSLAYLVCRLLLEKKKKYITDNKYY